MCSVESVRSVSPTYVEPSRTGPAQRFDGPERLPDAPPLAPPARTPVPFMPVRFLRRAAICLALLIAAPLSLRAEDGYELWLRYRQVADAARLAEYRAAITQLVVPGADASPTLAAARDELTTGLRGLLGADVPAASQPSRAGALLVGTPRSAPAIAALGLTAALESVGPEGLVIR